MGERYMAWLRRRHRAILGTTAAVLVVCGGLASRLELRPGLEELLPESDPRVAALSSLTRRMGQLSSLVVEIRSPDRAHNLAYADALARALDGEPLIDRAVFGSPELRELTARYGLLYLDQATLDAVRDRLIYERAHAQNPLLVELDAPEPLPAIERRAREQSGIAERLPGGMFQSASGDLVALVVLPSRRLSSADDGALEGAVGRAMKALPPRTVDASIRVRLAGEVHGAVRERRAIEEDVALTTVAVVILVGLAVSVYFGRLRALPLVALPALCGLTVAMAAARIAFGGLNNTSAFLVGIIVGNGINYPILALARYAEERASGAEVADALDRAVVGTARATSLAALAASAAYGSLMLTHFRGFSQFGAIGAAGMALSWVATMTVLPALVFALDRHRGPEPVAPRRANFGAPFAAAAAHAPWVIVAVAAALSIGALVALPRWLRDPFEYDFKNLRSTHDEDRRDDTELDRLFGRALSPQVLLTDSRDQARRAAAILRERARTDPRSPIAQVVTLDDLLPGSPSVQAEKLAALAAIRRVLDDPRLGALGIAERAAIARWRPPDDLRPLTVEDLPALARRPFTERDGSVGRVVLVYPPQRGFSVADGHDLIRLAQAMGEVVVDGQPVYAAGRAMIFTAMLEAIAHDAPVATFASFALVALITLTLLRARPGAFAVLATLAVGVLWMLGVAAVLDVKVSFLNFIALPITFGIGVDYGANLYLRYRAEGRGAVARAVATTGGAVALNSATTIIGYGSLLLAHNRALRSFGALAILGEVACLTAALLLLPAILTLRDRRAERFSDGNSARRASARVL